MKKIIATLLIFVSTQAYSTHGNITCNIQNHGDYSKVIIYGENEVEFVAKNRQPSTLTYDAFYLVESKQEIKLLDSETHKVLFYLDMTAFQGAVFAPVFHVNEDEYIYPEHRFFSLGSCSFN